MPAVLATAMMVGFVEATCIDLMRPHLDDGEHSVGIHIDMSHAAPTPAGSVLRAEVALEAVEGRILTFRVRAFDSAGPIGEGMHRRAVIRLARFAEKVAERSGTAAADARRPA
jgi:fluoroacetyl-CoA thioesterase